MHYSMDLKQNTNWIGEIKSISEQSQQRDRVENIKIDIFNNLKNTIIKCKERVRQNIASELKLLFSNDKSIHREVEIIKEDECLPPNIERWLENFMNTPSKKISSTEDEMY